MRLKSLLAAGAAAILAVTAGARAASIGINFEGGNVNGAPTALAGGDVAGAVPQDNWNNEANNTGGPNALVDGSGAATSASVSYSASGVWGSGSGTATGNNELMNGYIDTGGGNNDPTVNVTGVPYAQYSVFVYISTDAPFTGRDAYYTVNGVTQHIANYGYNGTLIQGDNGNYLLFTGVTGSALSIVGNSTNFGPTFRAPIAGIQIVQTPEPASVGLIGLGIAGAALRRRTKIA